MKSKKIKSTEIIDALNMYVYIVPSVKEAILTYLNLEYEKDKDKWTDLEKYFKVWPSSDF